MSGAPAPHLRWDAVVRTACALISRRTSSGAFLPEIDGLRFIAILLVINFHTSLYLSSDAPRSYSIFSMQGGIGVNIFFVLSGFILSLPFARAALTGGPPVRLGPYYLRRLTRLEPPYIVNLLILSGALVLVRNRDPMRMLPHLLASILYQHNFIYGAPSVVNSFAWSLEVEAQFYVLAPLLAVAFRPASPIIRRSLIGSAMVLAVVLREATSSTMKLSLPGQIEWFLGGLLVADLYLSGALASSLYAVRWDMTAVLGWPILFVPLPLATPLAIGMIAVLRPGLVVLLVVAGLRGPWIKRFLTWRPIYLAGGMCYSTYLYHGIVLGRLNPIADAMMKSHPWSVVFTIGFPITLTSIYALSVLVFVVFERPFMSWNVAKESRARHGGRSEGVQALE